MLNMANEHCNFNAVSFHKIPSNYYLSALMVLGNGLCFVNKHGCY